MAPWWPAPVGCRVSIDEVISCAVPCLSVSSPTDSLNQFPARHGIPTIQLERNSL